MLELKISNIFIDSLVDFNKEDFDKNLIALKPIIKENHGLAMDSALYDAFLQITDINISSSIALTSSPT